MYVVIMRKICYNMTFSCYSTIISDWNEKILLLQWETEQIFLERCPVQRRPSCSLSNIAMMIKITQQQLFHGLFALLFLKHDDFMLRESSYKKCNQLLTADVVKSCGFPRWLPEGMLHHLRPAHTVAQDAPTGVFYCTAIINEQGGAAGYCWRINNERTETERMRGREKDRWNHTHTEPHIHKNFHNQLKSLYSQLSETSTVKHTHLFTFRQETALHWCAATGSSQNMKYDSGCFE